MHSLVAVLHQFAGLPSQTPPSVPDGGGAASLPQQVVSGLNTLVAWVKYGGYGVTVMGLVGAAAAMAISHRSGNSLGEHGKGVFLAIAAAILIGSAASIVGTFA